MKNETFEAFCAAMENQSNETQMAIDAVAMAKVLNSNPAGDCMSEAREAGHTEDSIIDAALYASRS